MENWSIEDILKHNVQYNVRFSNSIIIPGDDPDESEVKLIHFIPHQYIDLPEADLKTYYIYIDNKNIGEVCCDHENIEIYVEEDWEDYTGRIQTVFELTSIEDTDDVVVGKPIPENQIQKDNHDIYESLLLQSLYIRGIKSGKPIPYVYGQYKQAIDWLESTDFFRAPGSTRFHDAEDEGLIKHTLKVYNKMCDMHNSEAFSICNIGEATLCVLVHDWCKIGVYEKYLKNVKNDTTGVWEKVPAFKYIAPKFPFGHGESSLFIAGRFFNLSIEESLAIRWHMGKWYTDDNLDNDLSRSNRYYPLVLLLQFSDMLSTTHYSD